MREDKSFLGLTLSLCAHILLWVLILFIPKPEDNRKEVTEITLVEPSQNHKDRETKWFADDVKVDKNQLLKDLKDKAKKVSKADQRVKEEMIARHKSQLSVNQPLALPEPVDKPQGQGNKQDQTAEKKEIKSSLKGLQPKPKQLGAVTGAQEGFGKNLVIGSSSVAESIPGVKEGSFTMLNTDQFTYYTFFQRVNEQIRFRWITFIRNYLSTLSDADLIKLSTYEKVTQIEIVLDDKGAYQKAFIHHASGDHSLDMTSIDAFQAGAPFLNPPKGLIEEDNLIHIHAQFIVDLRPRTGLGSN